MDRKAREEAVAFRHNALQGTFPAQGWPELDDVTPLQESLDGIKLYDRYRAEYYGYMSDIVVTTAERVIDAAPSREPFGLARYNGKPVESIKSFHDLYQTLIMSLLSAADELYFNSHHPPETLAQLSELMGRLSFLVEGAYTDPRSAVGDGINTAAKGLVLLLESMSGFLKKTAPELSDVERFDIIYASGREYVSMALLNLFELDALSYSTDIGSLMNELELRGATIVLKKGSFEEFPILPYYAEKTGVHEGVEISNATVGDVEFPYSHIGCPITLKPKTISELWRVGAQAAHRAGLL